MKNNNKKFVHTCKRCHAKEKVIRRCHKCLRFCCSECSVRGFCLDCHIEVVATDEKYIYFNDKYSKLRGNPVL
jgi:hypothetical protein